MENYSDGGDGIGNDDCADKYDTGDYDSDDDNDDFDGDGNDDCNDNYDAAADYDDDFDDSDNDVDNDNCDDTDYGNEADNASAFHLYILKRNRLKPIETKMKETQ